MKPIRRKILLDRSDRLQRLPIASESLSRTAERLRRRGVEVIDLSRVDPAGKPGSMAVPPVEAGWSMASPGDIAGFIEQWAAWYERRFGVALNPTREIAIVPNATLGLYLLAVAFVDAEESVLVPDPGTSWYRRAVTLAGASTISYRLDEANGHQPDPSVIESVLTRRTRMLVVASPQNPMGAVIQPDVFRQLVRSARRHQLLVAFDATWTGLSANKTDPQSLLQIRGGTGVGVEFHEAGIPFGYADLALAVVCGNRDAVSAIQFVLGSLDWCPSRDLIAVASGLIVNADRLASERLDSLDRSRRLLLESLGELGWRFTPAPTVPFIWAAVPTQIGAEAFCRRVLRRTGVLLAPGTRFGEQGEGFVRMTIPENIAVAEKVAERLRRHVHLYQRRLPRRHVRRSSGTGASTLAA